MSVEEKTSLQIKHDLRKNIRKIQFIFEEIVKESVEPELLDDMNTTLELINNDWGKFQSTTLEKL